MRLTIALAIIVVLALPLQGCGKKGPLTFPAPKPKRPASKTRNRKRQSFPLPSKTSSHEQLFPLSRQPALCRTSAAIDIAAQFWHTLLTYIRAPR